MRALFTFERELNLPAEKIQDKDLDDAHARVKAAKKLSAGFLHPVLAEGQGDYPQELDRMEGLLNGSSALLIASQTEFEKLFEEIAIVSRGKEVRVRRQDGKTEIVSFTGIKDLIPKDTFYVRYFQLELPEPAAPAPTPEEPTEEKPKQKKPLGRAPKRGADASAEKDEAPKQNKAE